MFHFQYSEENDSDEEEYLRFLFELDTVDETVPLPDVHPQNHSNGDKKVITFLYISI